MKIVLAIYLVLSLIAKDYKQYFNEGLSAYNKDDYSAAIESFSQSYTLQKHSKTSYYIALCYFRMGQDSLAQNFAIRAQRETPRLPDNPYQENINRIYNIYRLAPRFKRISVTITNSKRRITKQEEEKQKKIDQELNMYYSDSFEDQARLRKDWILVQTRRLENDNDLKVNMKTGQLYRDPIVDTLDH